MKKTAMAVGLFLRSDDMTKNFSARICALRAGTTRSMLAVVVVMALAGGCVNEEGVKEEEHEKELFDDVSANG
jgi:hypothetical protein